MAAIPPFAATVEALLASRLEQRILPGLDRIQRALAELGHPEAAFPSALIVGTNGKGSTAALLASVLTAHGVRVGLYTSPHLVRVEERIRVGGKEIAPERLRSLVRELARFPELSYFETLTAAAMLEFAESGVNLAVLEAGLGGRWDATNAKVPAVSMLTNVGTDHQAWLGSTRAAIAAEKAAALRGREAIVGAWDDEVGAVIRSGADPHTPISLATQWAEVKVVSGQWSVVRPPTRPPKDGEEQDRPSQLVQFGVGEVSGSAALPLLGEHQKANLTLALAGAAALARHGVVGPLRADAVQRGIEAVRWAGRLQRLVWRDRELILDGAHNREATAALAAALPGLGLAARPHLLFSCLDDKPLEAMAALLAPHVERVTVAPIASPRATPLAVLAAAFPGCTTAAGVAAALETLPGDRPTLVTGSLRLVGEVLAALEARHG